MSNQHNAIAQRIDVLRRKWQEKTEKHPEWKVARWLMEPADAELYTGMLKLESSPYGALPEVFVAMFTPFDDVDTFSHQLTGDWIEVYESEKEQHPELSWDNEALKTKLSASPEDHPRDELLLETLYSFSKFIGEKKKLVLSLVPRHVKNFIDYNDWVIRLYQKGLPDNVSIMLLDHTSERYLERALNETYPESFTLEPGDMNMKGAIQDLATKGDPADPQIQFRKCLFEMSKAVSKNRKEEVHKWGEQMLIVTQRTGDKNFFASAHLIFAGFLMHFKDESKTTLLLDQGIRIIKPEAKDNAEAGATLMQLYSYQGAQASMKKEYKEAVKWFMLQAQAAKDAGFPQMSIGAYKMALFTADRHRKLEEEYNHVLHEGYRTGLDMKDEDLKVTEYAYIAHQYLMFYEEAETKETSALNKRMVSLYGDNWRDQIQQILSQAKSKKELPEPYATHQ